MRDGRIPVMKSFSVLLIMSQVSQAAYDYDYSTITKHPHATLLYNDHQLLEAHLQSNGLSADNYYNRQKKQQ